MRCMWSGPGSCAPAGWTTSGFHCKCRSPAEQNCSIGEQELLAIMNALELWRYYLDGTEFTILTDHSPNFLWPLHCCPPGRHAGLKGSHAFRSLLLQAGKTKGKGKRGGRGRGAGGRGPGVGRTWRERSNGRVEWGRADGCGALRRRLRLQ